MTFPASVLRQAARADEIIAQHRATVALNNQPAVESGTAALPATVAPVTPTPPVPPTPSTPSEANKVKGADYWERRYKVVNGKYTTEVPQLHAEVTLLRTQLSKAIADTTRYQQELQSVRSAANTAVVSDPDEPEFDPQIAREIDRRVKAVTDKAVAERIAPVETRLNASEATGAANARERFEQRLNYLLRDSHDVSFQEVNADPDWLDYCAVVDAKTRRPNQELLNAAVTALDADRTAAIFQDYLDGNETPEPARTLPEPEPDPRLALIVPDRAASSAVPSSPSKRNWTRKEITSFYVEYSKAGSNRSTPESVLAGMKAAELDIQAAIAEGRVT